MVGSSKSLWLSYYHISKIMMMCLSFVHLVGNTSIAALSPGPFIQTRLPKSTSSIVGKRLLLFAVKLGTRDPFLCYVLGTGLAWEFGRQ